MASVDSLRTAIQSLHQAIAEHQDPQAKATLATCLQNMLKVQAQDHAPDAGGAQGGSQGPPQASQQGPGGAGVPAGLLQMLQGGGQ